MAKNFPELMKDINHQYKKNEGLRKNKFKYKHNVSETAKHYKGKKP